MDLINREAVIEAIVSQSIYETREAIAGAVQNDYKKSDEWLGGIDDAISTIEGMNAVPAVPLDKLCEWLGKVAILRCYECTSKCCDGEKCSSSNHFYKEIKKWMEEQDAPN